MPQIGRRRSEETVLVPFRPADDPRLARWPSPDAPRCKALVEAQVVQRPNCFLTPFERLGLGVPEKATVELADAIGVLMLLP
jgi:hypothetical protein